MLARAPVPSRPLRFKTLLASGVPGETPSLDYACAVDTVAGNLAFARVAVDVYVERRTALSPLAVIDGSVLARHLQIAAGKKLIGSCLVVIVVRARPFRALQVV